MYIIPLSTRLFDSSPPISWESEVKCGQHGSRELAKVTAEAFKVLTAAGKRCGFVPLNCCIQLRSMVGSVFILP